MSNQAEPIWIYRWGAKIFNGINDCPDDLAADAVQQTQKAIEEMLNTADAAQAGGGWEEHGIDVVKKIKAFLDEKYGPAFHVFIGKDFGAHVTHVSRNFIYLSPIASRGLQPLFWQKQWLGFLIAP